MNPAPNARRGVRPAGGNNFISTLKSRHFELLVALDDLRHVRKVAEAICVSQPAVSKTLAEIETGLGVKLFERLPKGLLPTSFGQCLIAHSRSVLATLMRARDELHELQSGESHRFTVGTNPHATVGVIPQTLLLMKRRFPKVTIVVREGHTEAHLMALWLGQLDVYVGRIPRECPQGLAIKIFSTESMKLVVGAHHPLANRVRLRWQDLHGYPWVAPPAGTQQRELLDRAFKAHRLPMPENRIETLSVHTLQAYLNSTNAIAAVAPQVARYYEELGFMRILPLAFPNGERSSGIAWNKERPPSEILEAFIPCVQTGYLTPVLHGRKTGASAPRRARG
jgi:DNA-binding transcriptional LysR family regulator